MGASGGTSRPDRRYAKQANQIGHYGGTTFTWTVLVHRPSLRRDGNSRELFPTPATGFAKNFTQLPVAERLLASALLWAFELPLSCLGFLSLVPREDRVGPLQPRSGPGT